MADIIEKSLRQLAQDIQQGQLSSHSVVQAFLARIEQVNPTINAVVQSNPQDALNQARWADVVLSKGECLGQLHGVPITVKDFCDVQGYVCTYGTDGYRSRIASTSSYCVQRLIDEGAIIIGLTNSPELAAAYETSNFIYGTTLNPYDLERSPGGSSGGDAALLAANGTPLGLASDGGGSIRVPAHYCGLAGIKPTQGLLSLEGINAPFYGMGLMYPHGTFGPLARYVEDLKLSLPILAQYNAKDPANIPVQIAFSGSLPLKNLRVGFYLDNGITFPEPDVSLAVQMAAQCLSDLGASVEEVRLPSIEKTFDLFWTVFFRKGDRAESIINIYKEIGTQNISELQKDFIADAKKTEFSLQSLYEKISDIAAFRAEMHEFMLSYDCILSPPCATKAKKLNSSFASIEDFAYTMVYNLLGWPAGVVRCATGKEGLPIGVQAAAKPWNDNIVLDVLDILERSLGGFIAADL